MQRAIEKEPPSGKLSGRGSGSAENQTTLLIHSTTTEHDAGDPIDRRAMGAARAGGKPYARGIVQLNRQYADDVREHQRRVDVQEAQVQYLMGLADWRAFWTLTLRDDVVGDQCITADGLVWKFKYLLRVLNADLFGKRYTRTVHHSYFAYAIGVEPHRTRDQLHAHVLSDRRVDFITIHRVWNKIAGFAWIEPVSDLERSVRYVCKYITKGGRLDYYRPLEYKEPSFKPSWYLPTGDAMWS